MFWVNIIIALVGVFLTYYYINNKNVNILEKKVMILPIFILIYSISQIAWCKIAYLEDNCYKKLTNLGLKYKLNVNCDDFYRIDVWEEYGPKNYGMFWKIPSVCVHQSTVTPSIMTFYINLGLNRDVFSKIPAGKYNNLRNFLSVRYIVVPMDEIYELEKKIPENFKLIKKDSNFVIYENMTFIKMGICFKKYISEKDFKEIKDSQKDKILLKAIILSDSQIERYKDILEPITEDEIENIENHNIYKDIENLEENKTNNFKNDSYGFSCNVNCKENCLVCFSVPYEKTFSATVNGKKTNVEMVNFGVMAVKCKKGNNNIIFKYETPGLKTSLKICMFGILLYLLYILTLFKNKKRQRQN